MIGLGELLLLAVVLLVVGGRSGVFQSRAFQTIWPWISPVRRTPGRAGAARVAAFAARSAEEPVAAPKAQPFLLRGNRLFWFLTILAATAVAAWIVTRTMILYGVGPGVAR